MFKQVESENMLKKLFDNKIFIFLFTFIIRAICCYVYGYLTIAG